MLKRLGNYLFLEKNENIDENSKTLKKLNYYQSEACSGYSHTSMTQCFAKIAS